MSLIDKGRLLTPPFFVYLKREDIKIVRIYFMKMSFYDWCIENNRQDLLDRWDYKMNNILPHDISYGSSKKAYFLCNKHKNHHSTLTQISSLTCNGQNILCRECHTFAQWVIDNYNEDYLNKIWNFDLNIKSPYEYTAKSHDIIYLNCDKVEYHKGYVTTPARYTGGQKMCGFCHMLQIHPNDSFATFHINKYGEDFLEKYWDYDKNVKDPFTIAPSSGYIVWIKCQNHDYHGSYDVRANDFTLGKSKCPYCRSIRVHYNDSIGYHHPNIIGLWSDKNIKTPFDYSLNSAQQIWLKCDSGKHKDFRKQARDAIGCDFRCPECTRERIESLLQEKVKTYIFDVYKYSIYHEHQCTIVAYNENTKHYMPYDNEIILHNGLHLIIEVNGEQHYKITPFAIMQAKYRNTTPEQALADQQWRDEYKKQYALSQGYAYLAIPYWTEKDESYKKLIDDKILSLAQQNN